MKVNDILNNELFKRVASGLILGFCFFASYFHSAILFTFLLLAILLIILFFEWPKVVDLGSKLIWFATLFYPVLPIFLLIYFNVSYRKEDILFPIYPFIVAFVGDTAAFIFGKSFGRHKVCPSISPKKSWEGLGGGFIGILIFNILFLPAIKIYPFKIIIRKFGNLFLLSFATTIVGFLGDIFISFLKRRKELKDTGNLLPGHGGLLDRFDSAFFITFLIAILLWVS